MQMQIGTFRFEVAPGRPEYQEMQRRSRRRWSLRDRYGLPPELEDLGRDATRIDLRGTVCVEDAADIEATARALESVMTANLGLASYGSTLPGGLAIVLPELPAVDRPVLRLWD